jgi:hypothetical protein
METKKDLISKQVAQIIAKFATLKGAQFIGIREYQSKTTGEVSNYVINANFSYGNAVNKDITTLSSATESDFLDLAKQTGFNIDLIKQAHENVLNSLLKNKDTETQSNQSKAQQDTYYPVTNSIKMHLETRQLYIYALSVNKLVLKKGEYKTVKSKDLTLAQNAVKKHFDLTTNKYRQFIVDADRLACVKMGKESFELI